MGEVGMGVGDRGGQSGVGQDGEARVGGMNLEEVEEMGKMGRRQGKAVQ